MAAASWLIADAPGLIEIRSDSIREAPRRGFSLPAAVAFVVLLIVLSPYI
jgi:hypothetical protein